MPTEKSRRASRARLKRGEVRNRILAVAEDLFSAGGLDGVSFRELTQQAGVSLSAIHYHFGSKLGLLSEVFARSAQPLCDRRATLLDEAFRASRGRPSLEMILEAFLRPAFESASRSGNATFNRLRARVALERTSQARKMLRDAFDDSDSRFIAALATAVPGLPRAEIFWRFHFLVGALIYTMADQGQLAGLSHGKARQRDVDDTLRRFIPPFAAAFRSRARPSAR